MNFDTKYVLLTGAGFTANIGTPLARDMWCLIFNHEMVQAEKKVKEMMLNDFDYESIYYSILEGNFSPREKEAISTAISSAYHKLDSIIIEWVYRSGVRFPLNISNVSRRLIDLFARRNDVGFFFTLNQDLFIERRHRGVIPSIPGSGVRGDRFVDGNIPLARIGNVLLPGKDILEKEKKNILYNSKFFYIKLHGSQEWISSTGNSQMVIGRGKEKQIQHEPLLAWYFELFEKILFHQNRRVLIIGYGFKDEHINKILSLAVANNGLEIHIISPLSIDHFYKELMMNEGTENIWNGLSGYYPCSLLKMFYGDEINRIYFDLIENFFG